MNLSGVEGKAAIVTGASRGIGEAIAKVFGENGMKVVCAARSVEQALQFFAKDCPAGRMGNPEECAYLALFLASDMARYITGAAIPVDGALSAGHQNVYLHGSIRKLWKWL